MRWSQLIPHVTKSASETLATFVMVITVLGMIGWTITELTPYTSGAVSNGIWIVVAGLLCAGNLVYLAHVGVPRSFLRDYLTAGTHDFSVLGIVASLSIFLRNATDLGILTTPKGLMTLIDVLFWGAVILVVVHTARGARQNSEEETRDAI